jgi:hypothetical protein
LLGGATATSNARQRARYVAYSVRRHGQRQQGKAGTLVPRETFGNDAEATGQNTSTANDRSARHLSFFILIQKLCHLYQKRFPFSRFFLPKPEAAQARSGRNAACLNGQSERDARRSGSTKEEESKAGAIIWSSNVAAARATTRASVICASAVPAPSAAVRWEERRERGSEAETTTTGNALWAGARHRAMHPSLTIAFAAKLNNLMVRVVSRYCSGPDCGRPRT